MRVKSILLFLALHITLFSFSQQGINYQAIVKDSDGMILKDSDVSIKFSLIYEDVNSTPIYIEEHQITTPSDGIVNIYIGSGTKLTTGVDFSEIDWSQNVFLKEELDTSGNYETMGTNQIASVPVAEFSRNTASIFTTSNTIQLGNDNIELVNTSGVVSATGFVGDGSRLTNVGLGGSIDENGNLKIVDHSPTMTTSQTNNVLIGSGVAASLTDAFNNLAIGASALASATLTSNNVAIGATALSSVTGENGSAGMNTAVGVGASNRLTEGWINVSVGLNSMKDFESGSGNVVVGAGAMEESLAGNNNTAIGTRALKNINLNGTVTLTVNGGGFEYPSGQGNTAVGLSLIHI